MPHRIKPCQKIRGTMYLPGDKSIAHRSVIMSAIAQGETRIENFSFSDDCKATINAIRSLGVNVKRLDNDTLLVKGVGLLGLKKPTQTINVGESATTMRILTGLLCAQNFETTLDGKESLRRRPMLRLLKPLRLMGAQIHARKKGNDEYPPLRISPGTLKAMRWKMSVASAQVKSAIILAGIYARGISTIYEPLRTRDHTERMLCYFKANIKATGERISIGHGELISPKSIRIPSDISSASFFIVLASVLKNSHITIRNVSLNQTRCGIIDVLKKMGAHIQIINQREKYGEPIGDLMVRSASLRAVTVPERCIPALIDELPILMVAASFAKGTTIVEGVGELRIKETDRISSMVANLSKMGIFIESKLEENKEVISIQGKADVRGGSFRSFGDHRTTMSMLIAGLAASSPSSIDEVGCVAKSFPNFLDILKHLIVS